jgi:hypothetical protein
MSVYPNQTNATPGTSFFAPIGSGGGGGSASNWYQYPALSTITYSGAGGIANFTEVYALEGLSTPQIYASTLVGDFVAAITGMGAPEIQVDSLYVSSINNAVYPPSGPIVGTLPIPADSTTVTTETIAGITANSIIIGTLTSSSACQIVTLTPGSNQFTIDVTPGAPSSTRFNYVIYPAAT